MFLKENYFKKFNILRKYCQKCFKILMDTIFIGTFVCFRTLQDFFLEEKITLFSCRGPGPPPPFTCSLQDNIKQEISTAIMLFSGVHISKIVPLRFATIIYHLFQYFFGGEVGFLRTISSTGLYTSAPKKQLFPLLRLQIPR